MTADSEFQRLLRAEEAADAARALAHRRDAGGYAGVAWSGMAPDPLRARGEAAVFRAATERHAALHRWRQSRPGRLLAAAARAEQAAEAVRTCVARGLRADDQRCDLAVRALEQAAEAARAAMDAARPTALTGQRCATNSASSNPSTA